MPIIKILNVPSLRAAIIKERKADGNRGYSTRNTYVELDFSLTSIPSAT